MAKESTGLVIVLTGDGKGKTTSALGQALRAVGCGLKVAIIQFIKARRCGEHIAGRRLAPELEIHLTGCGFVEGKPSQRQIRATRDGLQMAREKLTSGKFDMVILDEIIGAANCGLLQWQDILGLIDEKPAKVHLIVTGRGASAELIRRADLVTEMHAVKHPFDTGCGAQKGIEF